MIFIVVECLFKSITNISMKICPQPWVNRPTQFKKIDLNNLEDLLTFHIPVRMKSINQDWNQNHWEPHWMKMDFEE